MSTTDAEQLGADSFQQMAFSIDRTSVVAKTRALKAEYTTELAQDLKVHGLDAETELANILSNEILAEINREVVRTIYVNAKLGCNSLTSSVRVLVLIKVSVLVRCWFDIHWSWWYLRLAS